LTTSSKVTLIIYDIKGREIRTLVNGNQCAGLHKVTWNGLNETGQSVSPGIYIGKILVRYDNDLHFQELKMVLK
jgi:flagellar hook assembly protein FlgD